MYDVYLERSAQEDIRSLPKHVSERVVVRVKSLANDPRPAGCRKIVGSVADWRLRVGDYRIVYEIDDVESRVNVMRVKHRRDVYRR